MARERQTLAGGAIGYELELLKFSISDDRASR